MFSVVRSFRLFGKFRFGTRHDESDAKLAKGNLLEIFHAPYPQGGEYQSFARVSKIASEAFPEPPEQVPDVKKNVFLADALPDILANLADSESESFWVSRPLTNGDGGRRLFIFDGLFLDQFDGAKNSNLSERFPLLPQYEYNKRRRSSRICFGNDEVQFLFRLELGLAMPLPVGKQAADPDVSGGVLCLGGVYHTTLADPTRFTICESILAGPSNYTARVDGEYRLGAFCLAAARDPRKNIISFPNHPKNGAPQADVPHMQALLDAIGLAGQKTGIENSHVIEFLAGPSTSGMSYVVALRRDIKLKGVGHVVTGGPVARLDLRKQLGGLLEIDDRLVTVECQWRVDLSDSTVLGVLLGEVGQTAAKTSFAAALRFASTAKLNGGMLGSPARGRPLDNDDRLILRGGGLEEAARLSALTRLSLPASYRQPQSVLPALYSADNQRKLVVPLVAFPRKLECALNQSWSDKRQSAIVRNDLQTEPMASFGITSNTSLLPPDESPEGKGPDQAPLLGYPSGWPKDKSWRNPPWQALPIKMRMLLPAFDDKVLEPDPTKDHNHILIGYDPNVAQETSDQSETGDGVSFAIGNDPVSEKKPHTGQKNHYVGLKARLGSLAFTRSGPLLRAIDKREPTETRVAKEKGRLSIYRRGRRLVDPRRAAVNAPTLKVQWNFSIAIDSAQPVTVDIRHGDRIDRPADLLIRETPVPIGNTFGNNPPFVLDLKETIDDEYDWHLTANLSELLDTDGVGDATFTVLTQAPFSVYRFSRKPLSESKDDSRPVAEYDSDTRDWRLQQLGENYLFVRPPGATGEDADKPGMLEIHDPADRNAPIRPAPRSAPASPGDVPRRHVLDMRLSPPTAIWVDPSDLKRAYLLPEYRGRDLFRQSGDFGIGMKLTALRTELLYGLSTGLMVPQEADGRPGPRIAELQALTGQMVAPAENDPPPTGTRWSALYRAFQHRPERLEVWMLDTRQQNPFVPARFDKGLTFALRHTALLAPPVSSGDYQPEPAAAAEIQPPRFHERGLSGGALWPLESANITRVLAGNPVGTGGELDGFASTPLGDSGNQTVRFLNGYVTIITETREGRLQKQRVEILGRIAGLWHRAKHVVIYERTTAPSPQFTPYPNQPHRTHRPVLRKVEEFVEILQPSRRYPDMQDVGTRSRGFLEEVRFNSRVIHVNSAWGHDVGRTGWEVPLWNRGEAELRPQIYPYPDVAFRTSGEGADNSPQAIQECLDVANLYFYTDPEAATTTPDTDKWPVRNGIDTSGFGHPEVLDGLCNAIEQNMKPKSGQDPVRKPAAIRVLPGLRRFTWRLAPSAVRTRINAERGEKPIYAGVESVSLMRAPGGAIKDHESKVKAISDRLGAAEPASLLNAHQPLPRTRANAYPTLLPKYDAVVDKLKDVEQATDTSSRKAALTALRKALVPLTSADAVKELDKSLSSDGNSSLIAQAKAVYAGSAGLAQHALDLDQKHCDQLAANAAGAIRKRKLLFLQMVKQAETELNRQIDTLSTLDGEEVKKRVARQLEIATRDLLDQASQGIGFLRNEVASARAIVADWRGDAIAALVRARNRMTALRNAYDDEKPWSANRLNSALKRFHDEFDAVDREAWAALQEARQRMAVEIDARAAALGSRITTGIAHILKTEGTVLRLADKLGGIIDPAADAATAKIASLPAQSAIDDNLKKLQAKVDGIADKDRKAKAQEILNTLTADLKGINLDAAKETVRNAVTTAKGLADDAVSDLRASSQAVARTAKGELDNAKKFVGAASEAAKRFADDGFDELQSPAQDIESELRLADQTFEAIALSAVWQWQKAAAPLDQVVAEAEAWIKGNTQLVEKAAGQGLDAVDQWLASFDTRLANADQKLTGTLQAEFTNRLVNPVVDAVFGSVQMPGKPDEARQLLRSLIPQLSEKAETAIDNFAELPLSGIEEAKNACMALAGYKTKIMDGIDTVANAAEAELKGVLKDFATDIDKVINNQKEWEEVADNVVTGVNQLLDTTNEIANQIAEAGENVRAYVDRGADIISRFDGAKPTEVPGLALQLISAATQAPEIAIFRTNAERIRVRLKEAEAFLETDEVKGVLAPLGDALKSLGLDFGFKTFGDTFDINYDKAKLWRQLIPDLGGINLSDMLPHASIPGGLRNAVKVTHDLDVKAGRAWVRADVNVPMPTREPLFSFGPFTLFLRNTLLKGYIRAEASKDEKEVATTDQALLLTTIEAVVAGQVMVTLEDVAISYSSHEHLNFTLNPKKIRINPTLRFIQDTLGSIFGDELGGLKFIKEGGVPVGVEHLFSMPPLSLMYGTSGVSNIQIANRFSLRAYPDFVIANRFNLSRRELPFLFSIFIIGGTGYIQVDAEYRPFDKRLMVIVEAGAGGSAALGFACGPVSGGVFIALSVVLRYQKLIGGKGPTADDGLSVSLVLVIAGSVSLWGMVTVYLGLVLSISYHESGRVDGNGQLSVELRISRWFKLKFSTQVTYKLRDGKATTQVQSQTSASGEYVDKYNKARQKFEALDKARKAL